MYTAIKFLYEAHRHKCTSMNSKSLAEWKRLPYFWRRA